MRNSKAKYFVIPLLLVSILFSSLNPELAFAWEREGSGAVIVRPITGAIRVSNNLETGGFTITGSKEFSGQGTTTVFLDAPLGVYTINYKEIVGYETPQPETQTLFANGKIEFVGKYTPLSLSTPSLSEGIKQYTQEDKTKTVTVDGKEYYIATLKGYINPVTFQPSEYAPSNPSGVWTVYVDTEWQLLDNKDILLKIYTVDKANQIAKRIVAFSKAQELYDTMFALEKLESAEKTVFRAKILADISIGGILTAKQIADATASIVLDLAGESIDPNKIKAGVGYEMLQLAQKRYYDAAFTQGTGTEFTDAETATKYLNSLYTGFFLEVEGTGLAFSHERISKNPIYDLVAWGSNSIASTLTHKISKILQLTLGIMGLPSTIREDLESIKSVNSKVEELMNEPGLPFYYTLALAHHDIFELNEIPLEPYITDHVASPVELRVYDSKGRVTGIVSGDIKIEIPDSYYFNNTVILFFPSDSYRHEVFGLGNGSYSLTSKYVGNKTTSFVVSDVPISVNVTHQYTIEGTPFNQTISEVTLKIDSDGDKVFERSVDLFNVKEVSTVGIETDLFRVVPILIVILSILSAIYVIRKFKKRHY